MVLRLPLLATWVNFGYRLVRAGCLNGSLRQSNKRLLSRCSLHWGNQGSTALSWLKHHVHAHFVAASSVNHVVVGLGSEACLTIDSLVLCSTSRSQQLAGFVQEKIDRVPSIALWKMLRCVRGVAEIVIKAPIVWCRHQPVDHAVDAMPPLPALFLARVEARVELLVVINNIESSHYQSRCRSYQCVIGLSLVFDSVLDTMFYGPCVNMKYYS